jgi:hypothetical protein
MDRVSSRVRKDLTGIANRVGLAPHGLRRPDVSSNSALRVFLKHEDDPSHFIFNIRHAPGAVVFVGPGTGCGFATDAFSR